MKKNLLTIGVLAISFSVQAQTTILLHVDNDAKMFVSTGTLVYNGGGLQTRGTGMIDLRGNMMVVGNNSSDAIRTLEAGTGTVTKQTGSNIVVRLNDLSTYDSYGQLYINGFSQANLNNVTVSKEFKTARHGVGNYFQQIALPFSGKAFSSLSTEFGKTFGTTRYTQNEILKWNNGSVVSVHYTNLAGTTSDPTGYYMLGSNNNNLNTANPAGFVLPPAIAPTVNNTVFTLNGNPYTSDNITSVDLQNAGNNVYYGINGNNTNQYNELYNTYLQDQFESSASPWNGSFGRNIYQFGNPFFTNLDLSKIGYIENTAVGAVTDGNAITNIMGVRYDPGTVTTLGNGSTFASDAKIQTFTTAGVPVGDTGLMIKPMQTFVLKLRDNTLQKLNFSTLRRFNSTVRAAGTDYNVSANKNGTSTSVKQLGVIALDATGTEIARTYYAVSGGFLTGHQNSIATSVQATATQANIIGTFEEATTGGWDPNYTSAYWLYINEANETNFLGKNLKLVNYDFGVDNNAVSYKFEIKENAELVPVNTHQLSSGVGFYYKAANGAVQQAKQGDIVPILGAVYDLYYGMPQDVLSTNNNEKPSRTMVVYNPAITNYIVRFDPNWRKADIQVYDMSGKLVISKKAVSTATDFVIELDNSIKNSYVVKIVSDNGETVNTKILK